MTARTDGKSIVIRYTIDDIMAVSESNQYRPNELRQYYSDNYCRSCPIKSELLAEMRNIIKSRTDNIDPNDSSLMTYIREYLNRVCASNVDDIISRLGNLNYTTKKHFELLANELIIKAINDAMAYSGMESKDVTTSEICVMIASHFYPFCLLKDDDTTGDDDKTSSTFGMVLTKLCHKYFKTFTEISGDSENCTAYMNKYNQQRINNYKGLINMIGLLYISNLFSAKIIMSCLSMIKKMIIDSNLSQEECDNYYTGYEKLLKHIFTKFENADQSLVTEFNSVIGQLNEMNQSILTAAIENSKSDNRAERLNSIRKYSIGVHRMSIDRLAKIEKTYAQLSSA